MAEANSSSSTGAAPLPSTITPDVPVLSEDPLQPEDEQLAHAQRLSRDQVLGIVEKLVLQLLTSLANGKEPELFLVNRSERNIVRDEAGHVHLGAAKTVKRLFGNKASGIQRFTKIWQVLALVQRVLLEGKMITQREAYYNLVQYFRNQGEFNDTLQDVVALTGCARLSLGICASSSGGVAGLLLWQDPDGDPEDCSTGVGGKRIPGIISGVKFTSMGARYILVVEKDAVFTYLCGQRVWDTLPCIVITGCGYPPLSVRAVVKALADQFKIPVVGLFDYNPHGVQIMLTYKLGSARMGTEAHAHAVDIKWLGVHHCDLFGKDINIPDSALQPWSNSDERLYYSIAATVDAICDAQYSREVLLMGQVRLKAEIEAINSSGFDTLEQKIVQKVLRRQYI